MNTYKQAIEISERLETLNGRRFPAIAIVELIKASQRLRLWFEQECGDSNDHCSWSIERDDRKAVSLRLSLFRQVLSHINSRH